MSTTTLRLHCPRLFDGQQLRNQQLLELQGPRIVGLRPGSAADADVALPPDTLVAPGLIDIQVNGGGGWLFNDEPSLDTVRGIAQAHARCGTTALLPTFITDTRPRMRQAVASVREAFGQVPGVLGIHLEGPFLQVHRRGVHRADLVAQWGRGDLDLLSALGPAGDKPMSPVTLVTLAPECVPAGTVRKLRERGVRVFAGHSEASFEQVQAALAEGLHGFTHLYNAMSPLTGRAPGMVGAALLARQSYAGLILDGHHVAEGSVAVARAARGDSQRLVLVSDAMTPAGTAATSFVLQGQRIRVEGGRCVDEEGRLAGACITLADAVRIGVARYGLTQSEALASATRIPAELLGLADERGALRAGLAADLVVFDATLHVQRVMQAGQWLPAPSTGSHSNA